MKRFRHCLLLLALGLGAVLPPTAAPAQDLFFLNEGYVGPTPPPLMSRFDATGAPKPSEGNNGTAFIPYVDRPGFTSFTFGPDGNMYAIVNDGYGHVARYNAQTGALIDVFIPQNSGRLYQAVGLGCGPDGNLYVACNAVIGMTSLYQQHQPLRRQDQGAPAVGDQPGAIFIPGLDTGGDPNQTIWPSMFAFGPDGNLYVVDKRPRAANSSARIVRYDGHTGAYLDFFAGPSTNGHGSVVDFFALAFGPDRRLYAADAFLGVVRYDPTGHAWETFIAPNVTDNDGLMGFTSMSFGPDDNLYVGGFNKDDAGQVARYHGATGAFLDIFIPASLFVSGE